MFAIRWQQGGNVRRTFEARGEDLMLEIRLQVGEHKQKERNLFPACDFWGVGAFFHKVTAIFVHMHGHGQLQTMILN